MTTTSTTATTAATTTTTDAATLGSELATALGGGTGVDMTTLATEVADAQFTGTLANITTQTTLLTTQISEASQLQSDLLSLSSALDTAVQSGELASAPSVADTTVATATLPIGESGASSSYNLEVDSLASPQVLTSTTFASATSTTGSGTLTITTGTIADDSFTAGTATPVAITIASGATLTDIENDINSAGAGVTAYLATVSGGVQLVLKGAQGAASAFTVSATEASGDAGLSALAWDPSTGAASQLAETAADASYSLDGIAQTSASNTIPDAAPGLALVLTGTNVGNPTSITYSDPSTSITTALQTFTTGLNALATELADDTAATPGASGSGTTTSGALRSDLAAQAVMTQFQSLCGETIMPDAAADAPSTLADLGLSLGEDGQFTLDTTVLTAALQANPSAVAAMFTTGANGVYNTVFNMVNSVTSTDTPGSLDYSITSYTAAQTTLATKQTDVLDQQTALRAQLVTQYAATNASVAADKATISYLEEQVAAWDATDASTTTT